MKASRISATPGSRKPLADAVRLRIPAESPPAHTCRIAYTQVVLLFLAATFLDHVTGPNVSAAGFYIFPVALAGWKAGRGAAAVSTVAAIFLSTATIWFETGSAGFTANLVTSQFFHCFVYGGVAFLSSRLRQGYQLVKSQRDSIDQLNRKMADDLKAARKIQELLASPLPTHPAVEIGAFTATARILGGDILKASTAFGRLSVLVADVSGKGSPAALATAGLLAMLGECPDRYKSPGQALTYLNARLENYLPDSMFVTALYFLIDLKTGVMTWASAGHEPPLLRRAADQSILGIVEEIGGDTGSLPLGILADTLYVDRAVTLEPGDVLLCYTDGLTDLRLPSGERLGSERLKELFGRFSHLSCKSMISATLQEPTDTRMESLADAGLDDDITAIAIRINDRSQPAS